MSLYVYCLSDDLSGAAFEGLAGVGGARVRVLTLGGLAALVSDAVEEATAARTGVTPEDVRTAVIARIPLGRYGDPAELGRLGAFLLSPAASYLTGAIVPVDGGMVRSLP